MALTQSRMLALLAAAEDFSSALDEACAVAKRELALAKEDKITSKQALENISLFLVPDLLLKNPRQSLSALVREQTHFSRTRIKANEREAERQRRKRQEPKALPEDFR